MAFKIVIYGAGSAHKRALAHKLLNTFTHEIKFLPNKTEISDANVGIFILPTLIEETSDYIKDITERIKQYWDKGTLTILYGDSRSCIPACWLNHIIDNFCLSYEDLEDQLNEAFARYEHG